MEQITVFDHLALIRAHARDLQDEFTGNPLRKAPEILTMLCDILDRVLQIEIELGGFNE